MTDRTRLHHQIIVVRTRLLRWAFDASIAAANFGLSLPSRHWRTWLLRAFRQVEHRHDVTVCRCLRLRRYGGPSIESLTAVGLGLTLSLGRAPTAYRGSHAASLVPVFGPDHYAESGWLTRLSSALPIHSRHRVCFPTRALGSHDRCAAISSGARKTRSRLSRHLVLTTNNRRSVAGSRCGLARAFAQWPPLG